MDNPRTSKCWKGVKIVTVILCIFGFVCNSYVIFKQFVSNETVTSNDITDFSKLLFPSITMCGLSAFLGTVTKVSDLELDNYINNTINLKEMLYEIYDADFNVLSIEPTNGTISDESGMWKITTTYSAFRGRCYTLEYQKEVNEKQNKKYLLKTTMLLNHVKLYKLSNIKISISIHYVTGYCKGNTVAIIKWRILAISAC